MIGKSENNENILTTQRMKEIEIQIGMRRKLETDKNEENEEYDTLNVTHSTLEIEQSEEEIGWISLGWIDVESLSLN